MIELRNFQKWALKSCCILQCVKLQTASTASRRKNRLVGKGEKNQSTLLPVGGSDSDSPLFQTQQRFVKRRLSVANQRVPFIGSSPGFQCAGVNGVVAAPDFIIAVSYSGCSDLDEVIKELETVKTQSSFYHRPSGRSFNGDKTGRLEC